MHPEVQLASTITRVLVLQGCVCPSQTSPGRMGLGVSLPDSPSFFCKAHDVGGRD